MDEIYYSDYFFNCKDAELPHLLNFAETILHDARAIAFITGNLWQLSLW